MALFHVVEFLEEAEGLKGPVAVIPDSWLLVFKDTSGNRFCNWPPKSVKADANFIIKAKMPDSSWPLYRIRLHKSLSNYQAASQICERLKEMSEVESDDRNTSTEIQNLLEAHLEKYLQQLVPLLEEIRNDMKDVKSRLERMEEPYAFEAEW